MAQKTIEPESCDKCPFLERLKSEYEIVFNCKFYNKGGTSTRGKKFPFCKLEKIIVCEKED